MAIGPLPNETAHLRAVVRDAGFSLRFTAHARQEMANDSILAADARHILEYGSVTWIETKKEVQWHVEGRDIDGRSIRIVVVVYQDELAVKIITAMEIRRGA